MGDKPDGHKQEPTLELPSLRFRRRRRPQDETAPAESMGDTKRGDAPAPPQTRVAETPVGSPRAAPPRRRQRPGLAALALPTQVAAAVTGILVGLVGAGGTYLAMVGCEAVGGTSTCGEGAGLLLLVAVLAVMVLVGASLLKAFQAGDPGSTSFLAVGVVAVVVLLLLLDVIFSPWMFLVVPLLGGASYALASWVTTRFADEGRTDYER